MGILHRTWSILSSFLTPATPITVTIPPSLSFNNRTILITGATSGLGLEAAVLYLLLGAQNVVITARTAAKGEAAKTEILARVKQRIEVEKEGKGQGKEVKGTVEVKVLDMDSFSGVQAFVAGLKKDVPSLDIAILNAGVHPFQYTELPSGWETALQVNVLSTVLLGLLLLPWMKEVRKEGQVQHITFVGSGSHWSPDISSWPEQGVLELKNERGNYVHRLDQYGTSKLLLQYSMREIAALTRGDDGLPNPIINSLCPGLIKTDISRGFHNGNPVYKLIETIFMWMKASPVTEGAKSLVLAPSVGEEGHGGFWRPYLTDEEYEEKSKMNITSEEGRKMQAQVWKEIVGVLEAAEPEVGKIAGL